MNDDGAKNHWEKVFSKKSDLELSWHQEVPSTSLELAELSGIASDAAIIDIGGGTSRFAETLIDKGAVDISVLDLSLSAINANQRRLGPRGQSIKWISADITTWKPKRQYDLWHDRAVFHFLVEESDRKAYLDCLDAALKVEGHAIIGTFAPDGPEKCSGLPVKRYNSESICKTLGVAYELLAHRIDIHKTPRGNAQSFQFSLLRKRAVVSDAAAS